MTLRGTVKGNTIVIENGEELPEGVEVEIEFFPDRRPEGQDVFAEVLSFRAENPNLSINVEELLDEDRREREEHWDQLLFQDR